jgi:hypothetical protein
MNNTNKINITTTDPQTNRPSIAMTVTNVRIAIPIATRIRTNDPEMIALNQTRVIAPTPNRAVRAVRAVQVAITTEMVRTSTTTKRSTKPTRCTLRRHTEPHMLSLEVNTENAMKLIHYPETQKHIKSKR